MPLSAIVKTEETTGPLLISRQAQFPAVTVSFNLAPGVSLGEAVSAVDEATIQMGLPASIKGQLPGDGRGLFSLFKQRASS